MSFLYYPSRPALVPTQLPVLWVPEVLSRAVKRPGSEADHLTPFNAEVKRK